MNNVDLDILNNNVLEELKKHGLDEEGIKEFRKKIQKVSDEEATSLGKEMLEVIAKRGFNDDYEEVISYIQKGADVDYQNDTKGDFALLVCARKGYFKTFLSLIKAGANVNAQNHFKTTALMASARHGQKEMLHLLIILGADVNALCQDGDNALMSAKRHDQVECFDMLVKENAQIFHRNLNGESPIEIRSTRDFDLSAYDEHQDVEITPEDAQSLIEEATKKLKKFLP